MKQRLAIALLTILVLAAGYGTGVWTERHRCKVPPPPAALMGELSQQNKPPAPAPVMSDKRVAQLAAEIERLHPQIEEFRVKLDALDEEMDKRIDAILRPDQRGLFQELVKRGEAHRAKEEAQRAITTPLTPQEIHDLKQQPLQRLLAIVVVPIRLEWNTKQLKLDEAQRGQLNEILKWRREQFLELIDASPPPSLTLSKLAPLARRLVLPPPAEKPAEPATPAK